MRFNTLALAALPALAVASPAYPDPHCRPHTVTKTVTHTVYRATRTRTLTRNRYHTHTKTVTVGGYGYGGHNGHHGHNGYPADPTITVTVQNPDGGAPYTATVSDPAGSGPITVTVTNPAGIPVTVTVTDPGTTPTGVLTPICGDTQEFTATFDDLPVGPLANPSYDGLAFTGFAVVADTSVAGLQIQSGPNALTFADSTGLAARDINGSPAAASIAANFTGSSVANFTLGSLYYACAYLNELGVYLPVDCSITAVGTKSDGTRVTRLLSFAPAGLALPSSLPASSTSGATSSSGAASSTSGAATSTGASTSLPTSVISSLPTSGVTSVPTSGVTSVPTSGVTSLPTSGVTTAPVSLPTDPVTSIVGGVTSVVGGVTSVVGGLTSILDPVTSLVGGVTSLVGGATSAVGGLTSILGSLKERAPVVKVNNVLPNQEIFPGFSDLVGVEFAITSSATGGTVSGFFDNIDYTVSFAC